MRYKLLTDVFTDMGLDKESKWAKKQYEALKQDWQLNATGGIVIIFSTLQRKNEDIYQHTENVNRELGIVNA